MKVFYDPSTIGSTCAEISERAENLPNPITMRGSPRLIVHIQTTEEAVDDLLALVRQIAKEKEEAGFVKPEKHVNGVVRDFYTQK